MLFRPCIVIPCYNHGAALTSSLKYLTAYNIAIFIVDDGSNQQTQDMLTAISEPLVRLFRLPDNQGKGGAVMKAMYEAWKEGFSHALQVDADGQHNLQDIPQFLELSQANPAHIICGKPIYDDTVPRSRLWGRYATHFWVWIETLSFQIEDSMCGFRCYPLRETYHLINHISIPTRMDFDIEIIVRLYWQGLGIINVPTKVTYPIGGLSHFNMVKDNIRISKMHARLFFGMLPRSIGLLRRNFSKQSSNQHWANIVERGSLLGLKIIFFLYALLGLRVIKFILHFVVAYFFLTDAHARNISFRFLKQVFTYQKCSKVVRWRDIYAHFYAFAESAIDKIGAWRGDLSEKNAIKCLTPSVVNEVIQRQRGALFIGSHFGNLEMCRALASNKVSHKKINAVVYSEHAVQFTALLKKAHADFDVNLIHVGKMGVETAILLQEKIDAGEWVFIVGDRTPVAENGRVSTVNFLGALAPFAQGPWILASLLECPVYLFFCYKVNYQYQLVVEHFAEKIELPRKERQQRLQHVIEQYAQRLEHYVCLAPFQWFNFYDFWRTEHPSTEL
ncbi:MAG: glycosyltransferase [Pseudomonadota bacterium]